MSEDVCGGMTGTMKWCWLILSAHHMSVLHLHQSSNSSRSEGKRSSSRLRHQVQAEGLNKKTKPSNATRRFRGNRTPGGFHGVLPRCKQKPHGSGSTHVPLTVLLTEGSLGPSGSSSPTRSGNKRSSQAEKYVRDDGCHSG